MAYIIIKMDPTILDNGVMICSMAMEFKIGLMAAFILGNLSSNYRNFCEGKKNGHGKFTWPDGSIFEGELKNNTIEGTGKFRWPNGKTY